MASRRTSLAIVTATNGNATHEKLSEGRDPSKRAVGPAMGSTAAEIKMGDGEACEAKVEGMWGGAAVGPAMGSTAAEINMCQEPRTALVVECVLLTCCLSGPTVVA